MIAYGLIGWPLTTTFSPAYFQQKFDRENIAATYTAFPLEHAEDLPALLGQHPALAGLNVTIPHKTAIIPYLHALSPDAAAIGAVNCIDLRNGRLTGYNTDWLAFRDSLQPLLQPQHQNALILGTGGAAKAVAYALASMRISFKQVSRNGSGDEVLSYGALSPGFLQHYHLIINTTPLGMAPDTGAAPSLPYDALTSRHLLYDLIYSPAETEFLRRGAAQGAGIKNGYEMLTLQAEASWRIWQS